MPIMKRFSFISTLTSLALLLILDQNYAFSTPPISSLPQDSLSQKNDKIDVITFNSPEGWRFADKSSLPPSVKAMVIGKGPSEYPPSINLGAENYSGTLKQYLNRIKEINASQGIKWKDLGTIHTQAGDASLSQIDTKTQWGDVRMMHVILIHEGLVYILTAAALKDEFSIFYKDIFNSLSSLHFETQSA